jgi:hypothetical protein
LKKIFISHSSKNKAFIKKLKKHFPKSDYLVWISYEDIQPGKDSGEKIKEKLSECDFIIFILTKEALRSAYVNQEIGFALAKKREIIPIIDYEKCRLPGFLVGKDARRLFINSPKKTFLEIAPYLKDEELNPKHPYKEVLGEKTLTLTETGYEMWKKILSEMEKGPTPISSFVGSYESFLMRSRNDQKSIINRINNFNDFFVDAKIVESVNLENMRNNVYSYEDLKNWGKYLKSPVLFKLTKFGKDWIETWRRIKLKAGETMTLTTKKVIEKL